MTLTTGHFTLAKNLRRIAVIKSKLIKKLFALSAASIFSISTVFAQESTLINIPKVDDAQIFAEFTDKLPAVANYFTSATEVDVIAFYQAIYGEANSQERKRGRLTLYFSDEQHITRVVISQQNNKRQVDVLVENK